MTAGVQAIEPVEKKEYYKLSSAQKRMYAMRTMEKNSTAYNIPILLTIEGEPDREKLQSAFEAIIIRHEALRTSFILTAKTDEPVQRIHEPGELPFEIEYSEAGFKKREEIINSFIRPFNLALAPLLRVGLVKTLQTGTDTAKGSLHPAEYTLLVDMHHIVCDGESAALLTGDFAELYKRRTVTPLRIQYKDYAIWRNTPGGMEQTTVKESEAYWLEQYTGELPVLELSLDYPRPAEQEFEGGLYTFETSESVTPALRTICAEEDVTLYMLLLAVFNVLLARLGGKEDVVVGTPVGGRIHEDLKNIIGMFVNTLAIRNYPTGEKNFNRFLKEVKTQALAAFKNREYPFEELVDRIVTKRDASRNPLFDVLFVMQNMEAAEINLPGLILKPYPLEIGKAIVDLTFTCQEAGEKLLFTLYYRKRLFKEDTVIRYVLYFKKILSEIILNRNNR
ncbi:MAG: hypothetical protein GY757_53500 [bacterium]|nr:hypothetical protein [bacterium]